MKKILSVLALLAFVACSGEKNSGKNEGELQDLSVTVGVENVTGDSAVLKGKANLGKTVAADLKIGFQYSKSEGILPSNSTTIEVADADANYNYSTVIFGLEPSTTYYYRSFVRQSGLDTYGETKSFMTGKIPHVAVDLGIVMTRTDGTTYNLYWATSNLCEDGLCPNPEDYGDYYAWAETETKEDYSWSTYKFGTSESGPFSKYTYSSSGTVTVDNKTTLETGPNGDDVASKKLGANWRMPTDEEWTALRTNCTWTWATNYNGTGVAGRIVTSNINGYKDKSIFLPAAGNRYGTTDLYDAGSYGYYWSSSLYTGHPKPSTALNVDFGSDRVREAGYPRCVGQPVRPVYEGDDVGSGELNGGDADSEEPITGGGLVNYYGCKMSSSTVSSTAHVDINIYGTNVLGQSTGYGISTLKKTWASAICYVNGDSYNLDATDGASFTCSNSQYGTFYWTWAFKNTTVMFALMNASTANPVTIKMTDIKGNEYSFVYSDPQTINSSFYKY